MKLTYLVFAIFLSFSCWAQQGQQSTRTYRQRNIKATDTLDINNQMDFIIDNSDTYRMYKVIKKDWLNRVKKNIADSLAENHDRMATLNNTIESKNQTVDSLQTKITTLQDLNSKKDKVNILGMPVNKMGYHIFLWALAGLASILALYFYFQYKNAHKVTKDSVKRYNELDKEFNETRTKNIEREQALNRKILDAERAINELKKS